MNAAGPYEAVGDCPDLSLWIRGGFQYPFESISFPQKAKHPFHKTFGNAAYVYAVK